jgi:hypothetical protein
MPLRTMVDTLYLYVPEFAGGAGATVRSIGGSIAKRAIGTRAELEESLNQFVGVRFLMIDTHGSPGRIYLADNSSYDGMDLGMLPRSPLLLQPDVRVLFFGCSVGEGPPGDRFLDDVGRSFLVGKGGYVGAATVTVMIGQASSFATDSFLQPFSGGAVKVSRYDRNGRRLGALTAKGWI